MFVTKLILKNHKFYNVVVYHYENKCLKYKISYHKRFCGGETTKNMFSSEVFSFQKFVNENF
jgi:hypothetical protein